MHHPRIEQDFLHVNLLDDNSAKEGTPDTYEDSEGNIVEYKLPVMSPTRVDLVFRAIIGALPPREEQDQEQGVVGTWDKDQWREKFNIENIPPTMIFANTAGKARELAAALAQHEEGLLSGAVGEFHKLVPTYEKQDALEKFRAYADSGVKVLVCTDAAAR
jgi:superfamily II DNA/RNA helicase